jgi:pyruvate/2-oxoglutarate dehydrogenase complex dihydrolipoamide dehydrogenase (E3) component
VADHRGRFDLVIVGMGSGGMVAAEFAASLPIRVAVVERARVGGDCLWTGCVPSKALLASSKAAHTMRTADRFGLPSVDPEVDTEAVWKRVRAVQQEIASTDDDPARFEAMGVELVRGAARIVDPHTVAVGERRLRTRFVLVCTGSRPAVPPMSGLVEAGFLTSETVFELERPPSSVAMIGGGPIAVELAQAFTRLGMRTTVLQRGPGILPRDEPALVSVLTDVLRRDGVDLRLDAVVERVTVEGGRKIVHGTVAGEAVRVVADDVFVAVGRRPNVEGLGLEDLGVEVGPKGVVVDERMRTAVPSVYAAGDVAGRFLFTHAAGYEAVRAVRDMFFPGRGTASALVPWCTFTDPELAHAGLTSDEARDRHDKVEVHRLDLSHSDRARADGHAEGAIIAITAKGRLVGAHVLAPSAGELIHELALGIHAGMTLSDLAGLIHVYPTLATSVGQLAAETAFAGAARYRWLVKAGSLLARARRR